MKNTKYYTKTKPKVIILASVLLAMAILFGALALKSSAETDDAEITFTESESAESTSEGSQDSPSSELTEQTNDTSIPSPITSENIFDDIYRLIEANADKIFSILAFIGTLVVSIGYKSGLLPLLRDALSRLKSSIDKVKEEGENNNRNTNKRISDINSLVSEIKDTLVQNTEEISRVKWQFESYEEMCREREKMRTIMQNQIDMLYAIFMSSALPQYQKDEIGTKISKMREELCGYETQET